LATAALVLLAFAGPGCERTGGAEKAQARAGGNEAGHDHKGHQHGGGGGHDHDHGEGHADEVVLTSEAIRSNGIRVASARRQPLVSTFNAPARVSYNAEQVAHVGAPVAGRVAELKARLGDSVAKGDTLLVVDSPELGEAQSDYLQKRTAVETAKAAVELAQASYERAQQLEKSQNITRTDVEKRLGDLQAAKGSLRTASAALTAAANRLQLLGMDAQKIQSLTDTGEIDSKYAVRSPIAGRVVEREATLGELVGPEKDKGSLARIANLDPIWVLVDVPESKLTAVPVGSKAKVSVPALGRTFDGTISYISTDLDASTRTVRVRVAVENAQLKLLPGMFALAEITAGAGEAGAAEPVVAVPEEAVQTVEGEPAVFVPVEGEPNTFAKRRVGVGAAIGGMVPVFAGLKEGERYVAGGSFILKAELGKAGAEHEH
jgi:cobalt-zinc-cadmium efflux system membrane fusion protein